MAINWHTLFFYLMAILASGFALAVVLSSNIVRMAFYLVLSLGAVAGLFFLAGADFVGALQLMIYVGGTLVLLIFGVMLTARGPFVSMTTSLGQWVAAGVVAAALLAVLLQAAFSVGKWTLPGQIAEARSELVSPTSGPIGLGLLGVRVDRLTSGPADASAPLSKGPSGYLLPFEIVSVHLVVVLVGAAFLARAKRRRTPPDAAGTVTSQSAERQAPADPVRTGLPVREKNPPLTSDL
jgi:NADH-quinone oxidoreductase subunit J